jgi:5-methylcytosine-specific restriction endonuclease McrA
MKIPKKINYKKRLWKVFSEYIRRRDKGCCFTCGTVKDWKEMDAGHYIPAGQSPPPLYFSEKNVNCQCTSCNRFKHGNLSVYTRSLMDKFGTGIIDELFELKRHKVKWNAWTYQVKIDEYKKKLEEIGN